MAGIFGSSGREWMNAPGEGTNVGMGFSYDPLSWISDVNPDQQAFARQLASMPSYTAINSGNAPDAVQQAQRDQRAASDWMAQNMPKPELGPINRQTYNDINQIYYRHYRNGTYGSPEMFNELRAYMDTIRQQRESTPQPTPMGTPQTREYMGMGWYGAPVVETSYQNLPTSTPINTPQNRANLESRLREMLAKLNQKGGSTVPTIGGPGGLPGIR